MRGAVRCVVMCWPLAGCAQPTSIGDLPAADSATSFGTVSGTTADPTVPSATVTGADPDSATTLASATAMEATDTGAPFGPGPMRAFSLLASELQGSGSGGATSVGTGLGDPDELVVIITTGPATCDEPLVALPCGVAWEVSFSIPTALQVPGTYSLFDELSGTMMVTGDEPLDCSFGGGSFDGTAVLDVVDGTAVRGRIMGSMVAEFDANGDFDAPRCP